MSAKIASEIIKNVLRRTTTTRATSRATPRLGSSSKSFGRALEGEGEFKILSQQELLDQLVPEHLDLATQNLRRLVIRPSKLAQESKRKQLLDQIENAERGTENRRRINAEEAARKRHKKRTAPQRTPDSGKRDDDRGKPAPVLPPPPDKPQLPPPVDVPELPPAPDVPKFPPVPKLKPVPMLPPPTEPIQRKRRREEDDISCEEAQKIAKSLGLPPPICDGSGETVSISGFADG